MEMGISKTTTSTEVTDDNSNSSSTTHTQTRNHISFAAPYAVGEKVLTNHSDCLYEAKVVQYYNLSLSLSLYSFTPNSKITLYSLVLETEIFVLFIR